MKEVFRIHRAHRAAWLALLLCALPPARALAQPPSAPEPTGRPGFVTMGDLGFEIPDVEVLDQDGRKVRFYSDLIKDRVVVVSLFFTSCSFICPLQGRALSELQAGLPGSLGKDVYFVLISRNPETDTPERLKQWGDRFGAGRGWTFVTGGEAAMKKLLRDFTGENPGTQMHQPVLLIGNDRTGVWTEADGLSETGEIVKTIDRISGLAVAEKR